MQAPAILAEVANSQGRRRTNGAAKHRRCHLGRNQAVRWPVAPGIGDQLAFGGCPRVGRSWPIFTSADLRLLW